MIDPKCCRCHKELKKKGGVLLMPPDGTRRLAEGSLEADLVSKLHLCVECSYDVVMFLTANSWEDVKDEWTNAIKLSHPARSESHEEYGVAMQMVGHRHSKGELVALVNWLLVLNRLGAKLTFKPKHGSR